MKKLLSLSLAGVLLVAFTGGPITAHQQRSESRQQHSHQQQRGSEQREAQQQEDSRREESPQDSQAVQANIRQRRAQIAKKAVERLKEVKYEVCERKKKQLQRVIPKLATQATALKDAIDRVYDNVQGFAESEQVVVSDYEAKKASLDKAQVEAAAAVGLVEDYQEDYQFELENCGDPHLGQRLDTFRLAVTQAQDALHVYRDELVSLIQSMRAQEADNAEQQGENQNGSPGDSTGTDNTPDEEVENGQ
jgi:cytochrome c556